MLGGYRYSPPGPPVLPHTPGTPLPHRSGHAEACREQSPGPNSAMGLISVDQLSLYVLFSGSEGMTEVYNLSKLGNPNDHFVIPGTD